MCQNEMVFCSGSKHAGATEHELAVIILDIIN